MNEVYIVSAVRTPIGSFGGMFANVDATKLGAAAIKGALEKAQVNASQVEEVFMGNVCSANLGQAPARQAALAAGIGYEVPCTTVNKVCSSGAKSIMLAAQSIKMGGADIMVAGGMENMSMVPYYVPKARFGYKYGDASLIDGLAKDGLMDPYDQHAMGIYADRTAEKYNISREEQDSFAISSYERSAEATESGKFAGEIVSVMVPQRKGDPLEIKEDEEYKKVRFEKIPSLRPAFTKDGTVTAANASTINDGASALVLVSEKKMKELGLKPLARIVSFADAAQEPAWFTTAPTLAAPKALKMAGMSLKDVDYFEVNEAFSVVTLAFNKVLDIDREKVNIHGGAVSLGHPLGASGARIVTTLNGVLQQNDASIGCAAICNGGGGASSIVLEKA
ncbi:MAG: acetyl-CoA C-acyltransferase [Bacteroidia bacterium]|nr:acetyl-CoA C-acyltransferase [Bacteroidia bacterium]